MKFITLKAGYLSLNNKEKYEFGQWLQELDTCYQCCKLDQHHIKICSVCNEEVPKCLIGFKNNICIRCGIKKANYLCTCTGGGILILSEEYYGFGFSENGRSVIDEYEVRDFHRFNWCNGYNFSSNTIHELLDKMIKHSERGNHLLPERMQLHKIIDWLKF